MGEAKRYSLVQSFSFALSGIFKAIKAERNLKIHLVAAFLVVLLGIIVGLTKTEWLIIILIIFVILAAETFNSAIEGICNLLNGKLNLGYHETKVIRDASAGAVLLLAIASIILGLIIFLPHLLSL